ncbi:MAG: 50S ribosomal protein L18 [Methanomicrobia archaeon]|nr:50S ribosomal protein L18 [Methanomicrobia archaeon]
MGRARGPTYRVPFRRRREGKTDYRRRLKLLFSRKNRVVVRKSNKYIRMQLIGADNVGDKTLVSASSSELQKYGFVGGKGSSPAAYLTGLLFGKRALDAGFAEGILDIGLVTPVHGSNVYAALKGALDGGLAIPHDPGVFPNEERISGSLIASYLQKPDAVAMNQAVKEKILHDEMKGIEKESTTE